MEEVVSEQQPNVPIDQTTTITTIARISTKPTENHSNARAVVTELNRLITELPEDKKQYFSTYLATLDRSVKLWEEATVKRKKDTHRQKMEEAISRWNKCVARIRAKNEWAKNIPTINTKTHHSHGMVGPFIAKGGDTFHGDTVSDEATKSVSLCTHGKHTKRPCCVVLPDTLEDFLSVKITEPNCWTLNDATLTIKKKNQRTQLIDALSLKCQQVASPHCKSTGPLCGKLIPLKKILRYLPRNVRKSYTQEIIYKLCVLVYGLAHPNTISYCQKPTCTYARIGIIPPVIKPHDRHDSIYCEQCTAMHNVHAHKMTCPDPTCGLTFCGICKMSPYHDTSVCQGPKPDPTMDDETYRILCQTTRPCPGCKARAEKTDGCDHIRCLCGTDWCWRCLQKLDPANPYRHSCLGTVVAGRPDGAFHDIDDWGQDQHWNQAPIAVQGWGPAEVPEEVDENPIQVNQIHFVIVNDVVGDESDE